MIFTNGKDIPLNKRTGSVPNVSGAMLDWFQPMTFDVVVKTTEGFIVYEEATPLDFQGVWQPLSGRQLLMKPEGQRDWNWFWLHAEPSIQLSTDDVVVYLGVQYRVMTMKEYDLYGYREFHLVEDYTGAGPVEETP